MEAQPSHNTLKFSGFSNDLLTRMACIMLPSPHRSCQTQCWPLLHHSSFYFCNLWFPNTALTLQQHCLVYLWYRAQSGSPATTAVCCDPNQRVIQWEAHNRNGLLHYIVPPLHSPQKIAVLHDKKHGRKVALYTAVPSILCLENGQFSFCRRIHRPSWTCWGPLPLIQLCSQILWQKHFATGSANVQISCSGRWWILESETGGISLMAVATLEAIITSRCIASRLRRTPTYVASDITRAFPPTMWLVTSPMCLDV